MPTPTLTLNATGFFSLGLGAPNAREVGRVVIQVIGNTWSGSALPQARVWGAGIANGNLKSIPYLNVATGAVIPAGNAITADGIYEFQSNGTEIVLNYTHTSGSAAVSTLPVLGTATFPEPMQTSDGISITTSGVTSVMPYLYNDAGSLDKQRANSQIQALASGARTTTQTLGDFTNYNARGLHVILDMTNVGTGSVTLSINAKDTTSGKYYLLLAGAAVTTNSTNVYKVYPGLPATANVSANDILPRTFQLVVTANNANAATYSVGYSLVL